MTEKETLAFMQLVGAREQQFKDAQNFLDAHEDENGNLSAKDKRTYDRMQAEIKVLTKQINDELIKPLDKPFFEPFCYNGATGTYEYGGPFNNNISYKQSGVVGNEYHRNFIQAFRTNFKDAKNYLREGELSDGGYLVPESFNSEIVTKLQEENVLRQISKVITTASEHRISFVSQKPTASWVSEGEEIQFTDTQFGRVSLNAYKLAANLKVTNELLQDSYYNLEEFIVNEFSKSFGRAEEESFLNGAPDISGDQKQPTGLLTVLNQSATGTLQTTGSEISADDILTLIYSLDRPYRKSAVFLASDAVIMGLRKLKDSTQNFIWQPSLQEGEPPKLFGVPIYSSNFMPAPTSGNTALVFGDFKNYFLIGERGDRTFRPLRELYATSDQTGFLMIERIDCVVTDTRAFRGLKIRS